VVHRFHIGAADVHPWALADRLQALKNLDVLGGIVALGGALDVEKIVHFAALFLRFGQT